MIDYCPNCGNKDTLETRSDDEIYCPPCNQSFKVTKGKAMPVKKGRFATLEDRVVIIEERTKKVEKTVEDFF